MLQFTKENLLEVVMIEYKLVDDQTNILGDKIRMYRQMREMNQIQLAEASGINVGTIRKYELGLRKPKPEQLEKIAAALHLNVSVFLDINIKTVGDVLSLLFALDNACDMNLNCQEDGNGNKSFNISFSNIQLQQYLENWYEVKKQYESAKTEIEEDDLEENYKKIDRRSLEVAYLEWKIATMASYVSSHEYATKGCNGIENMTPGFAPFIW